MNKSLSNENIENNEINNSLNSNLKNQNNVDSKISKCINLHGFFKSIQSSFIDVFVPLIIYTHSTYQNTILYLLILIVSTFLSNFIFYKLIKKHSFTCIALNYIFILASYLMISLLNLSTFIVVILAIMHGFGKSMYYGPMHILVTKNKKASNFASFEIFKTIGVISITFFNGYILNLKASFSIWLVCLISSFFFILSYIPLLMIKNDLDFKDENSVTLKSAFKELMPYHSFNILFGIKNFIVKLFIPIFLLIKNVSFESIVYITIITNVLTIIMDYVASKMYKTNKSILAVIIASLMYGLSCVMIAVSDNIVVLYIFSIIPSITFPFFHLTTFKEYTVKSKNFTTEAIVLREMMIWSVRILFVIPMFFTKNLSFILYLQILVAIGMIISSFPYFKNKKVE